MFNYITSDNLIEYVDNDDYVVVYGDNMIHKGKAGSAIVRDYNNSIGIPTKRLPCLKESCFFKDRVYAVNCVAESLEKLKEICSTGKIAVFPRGGIGNGLADLSKHSPNIYKALNYDLLHLFGFNNEKKINICTRKS